MTEFQLDRGLSRPMSILTVFYLDRRSFISTDFYLAYHVLSGQTEFHLDGLLSRRPNFIWIDRVLSRRLIFIWTYRVSSRTSFISSTKFYLDRPSFISTDSYLERICIVGQVLSEPTEFHLGRV